MPSFLFEKFNIVWALWKGLLVPVGGTFWYAASGWHYKKTWWMVELLWLAAAHVYIEQCIDMFNVFKVNYVTRSQSDISWRLTIIFLKFNHVWFLICFSVAGQRKFFSLISRRSLSHWLQCWSVELKTTLQKFVGLIIAVSNIFLNINNSDTIIALISKVLYCVQQWLTYLRLYY